MAVDETLAEALATDTESVTVANAVTDFGETVTAETLTIVHNKTVSMTLAAETLLDTEAEAMSVTDDNLRAKAAAVAATVATANTALAEAVAETVAVTDEAVAVAVIETKTIVTVSEVLVLGSAGDSSERSDEVSANHFNERGNVEIFCCFFQVSKCF